MSALAELLGESPAIVAARSTVERLLRSAAASRRLTPILIQGETGTGKGLLAHAIHRASARAAGPFVTVNCVAIPETLLESELFGFERGAFTDARAAKPGLFQTAHRGSLLLDEVGLLTPPLQGKLLTALDERAVRRLGSTRPEPFDAQLIAATNEDLAAAMRARRFREDLYHRLSAVTLTLPPLRERAGDIALLAEHFLRRACAEHALPAKRLTPDARAALARHPWPGNVRELANVLERAALLAEGAELDVDALGLAPTSAPETPALDEVVGSVERGAIEAALDAEGGNISRAAARLGVHRNTLRYRMERLGLVQASGRSARPRAVAPASAPSRGPAGARWERRHIAALGVIVSEGTAPPSLELGAALELLTDKARAFGGQVEGLTPAGFMMAFGLEPVEDAPVRAVLAAMALRGSVARHWRADDRARLRLTVHVGRWGVARTEDGRTLDLDATGEGWAALRGLAGAAAPEAIVASASAAPFLRQRFHLDPLAGTSAFRVVTDAPEVAARGRAVPFVGRGEELELLRGRLAAALDGHGAVVALIGGPGIGKSRLLAELRAQRPAAVRHVAIRGESYASGIPLFAVADLVRRLAGLEESDAADVAAARLRDWLEEADLGPGPLPLLLRLLGLPDGDAAVAALTPEAVRTRTFQAVLDVVLGAAGRTPLLLECEDLHWMDGSSAAWLGALVEHVAEVPLLVVATYRPGYEAPWRAGAAVTQIALAPLTAADSRRIVEATFGDVATDGDVVDSILARAEGHPFFLEELARVVREGGAGAALVIPETVEGTIRARIDRLTEPTRHVLQTAAVLGRAFPRAVLASVCGEPTDAALAELVRLEFLGARGHGAEPGFAFRHALIHDVAYAGLSEAERRGRHVAAAESLEKLTALRAEDVTERLAHHYAARTATRRRSSTSRASPSGRPARTRTSTRSRPWKRRARTRWPCRRTRAIAPSSR
jgi:transcriptional regulator with AAA-type ATPase domain